MITRTWRNSRRFKYDTDGIIPPGNVPAAIPTSSASKWGSWWKHEDMSVGHYFSFSVQGWLTDSHNELRESADRMDTLQVPKFPYSIDSWYHLSNWPTHGLWFANMPVPSTILTWYSTAVFDDHATKIRSSTSQLNSDNA